MKKFGSRMPSKFLPLSEGEYLEVIIKKKRRSFRLSVFFV